MPFKHATFESAIQYRTQYADKGVATRRKNQRNAAASAPEPSNDAPGTGA